MPETKKKKVKSKTVNKNKNKNKNTIIVNVNSHNKRKVASKSGGGSERYPHSHFGIPPPVHVVVNHITPDQKPMNVHVPKVDSTPITHAIGIHEEKKDWVEPEHALLSRLVAADERAKVMSRLITGKPVKEEADAAEEAAESPREGYKESVAKWKTPKTGRIPQTPVFTSADAPKATLTSGLSRGASLLASAGADKKPIEGEADDEEVDDDIVDPSYIPETVQGLKQHIKRHFGKQGLKGWTGFNQAKLTKLAECKTLQQAEHYVKSQKPVSVKVSKRIGRKKKD